MKKYHTIENVLQLARVLGTNARATDILQLQRAAKRLATIDVHACNGTKYAADESYRKAVMSVLQSIKSIEDSGIYFYHQSDPRGCSLYIDNKPIGRDNYNTQAVPVLV
jgi:hypothetical protein